jgi:undecaprenyl-diphosphatase
MTDTTTAIILGIVEGVTEYLPVSSTGHLILFGEALQFTGDKAKSFDIVIQLGAILSVLVLFRERFVGLFSDIGEGLKKPATALEPGIFGVAGIFKLALVSFPALAVGFIFRHKIKEHLFAPLPVAIALAVGALLILVVERSGVTKRTREVEQLTWQQSLVIGIVQCLALWPGMSRSASTIIGGMFVGLSRRSAAEFSFLAAVPVLSIAALHDLVEAVRVFSYEDMKLVAIGFVISFISAFITMRWFIRLVSVWTLRPFAYYRLCVAALVIFLLVMRSAEGR